MTTDRIPPIANSYWLPDHSMIAGEYPWHPEPIIGRRRIAALLDAGVRTLIDLTEQGELEPYDWVLDEEAIARRIEISHVRIPIRDMRTPGKGVMRQILDEIARAQAEDRLPYVHCWGGVGRTGTVVGCHLVEQGSTCDNALAMVQSLFAQTRKFRIEGRHPGGSPETDAQKEYVRGWTATEKESPTGKSPAADTPSPPSRSRS